MPAALGEKCERALVAVLYVGSLRDAVRGNAHLSAASSVRSLGDNCTDFFVSVGLESAIHKGSHPALPSTSRQEAEQVLLALRPKWHAISEHPNATSAMSTSGSHDCVRGADFVQGNICVFGPSVERGRAADHGPPECAKPTCDYCAPTAMYPMYRRWGEAVRQLYAHEELRAWRYTYVVLMRPDIVVGGQLPSLQSNFSWPESGTVFVHSDQYLVASREDVSLLADLSVDGPTCASRAKMNAAVQAKKSIPRACSTDSLWFTTDCVMLASAQRRGVRLRSVLDAWPGLRLDLVRCSGHCSKLNLLGPSETTWRAREAKTTNTIGGRPPAHPVH